MHRKTMFFIAIAIVMFVCAMGSIDIKFGGPLFSTNGKDPRFVFAEKYRPPNSDYKYGFVDTNSITTKLFYLFNKYLFG